MRNPQRGVWMSAGRAVWSRPGTSLGLILALVAACGFPRPPDVGDDDVGCASDVSCGGPTPFCVDRVCAVCKASASCPAARPVCDATSHDCRSCARDSECDSGACDLAAGRCVDPGAILYASPSGIMADPCTRSSPCSLDKASSAVDSNHSYIVLLPGVHKSVHFDGQKATVCGNGATIGTNNTLLHASSVTMRDVKVIETVNASAFGAGTAFLCNDSDLTLDDVDIHVTLLHAIDGGRTLTLRNTTIANGRMSTGAHVIIDRSTFLPGSSISLFGTDPSLEVTNSVFVATVGDTFIAINGTPGSTAPGSAWIFNNTFIGGGIGCSGSALYGKTFSSNIFYSVGVQTEPGCRYDHNLIVPFVDYGGTGNITGDPLFVNVASNDFHLRAGSPAIDAADPALVNGHDRDGHPRPGGGRSDIGAFEYRP
jgi:hypothetical protein